MGGWAHGSGGVGGGVGAVVTMTHRAGGYGSSGVGGGCGGNGDDVEGGCVVAVERAKSRE